MLAFLNGNFVPEAEAKVSIFDRCFLYGDGLFETLLVCQGKPFRWRQHIERLMRGAKVLGINVRFSVDTLAAHAGELIRRTGASNALLRITLSRGVGRRGYSPSGANEPVLAMGLQPAPTVDPHNPNQWRLITSSYVVPARDRLAELKTCNKLHQVMSRAEAEARGADEALLLSTDGSIAEASAANVFWIEGEMVLTPSLASGALDGITRAVILELCDRLGISASERVCPPEVLGRADGVFLSLSSLGIVEVLSLDGKLAARSRWTVTLHRAYQDLVARESQNA